VVERTFTFSPSSWCWCDAFNAPAPSAIPAASVSSARNVVVPPLSCAFHRLPGSSATRTIHRPDSTGSVQDSRLELLLGAAGGQEIRQNVRSRPVSSGDLGHGRSTDYRHHPEIPGRSSWGHRSRADRSGAVGTGGRTIALVLRHVSLQKLSAAHTSVREPGDGRAARGRRGRATFAHRQPKFTRNQGGNGRSERSKSLRRPTPVASEPMSPNPKKPKRRPRQREIAKNRQSGRNPKKAVDGLSGKDAM